MRIVWVVPLLVLALVLGAVQFVASVALRDRAEPGSWIRLVPPSLATRTESIDPAFPLPPALRLVLARRALERGDASAAQAYLDRLPASRDRLALEGRLAESRNDDRAALQDYVSAGDLDDVERHVDALANVYRFDPAIELQHAVVAQLQADPTQTDALARAYYELGLLEESHSYRLRIFSKERRDAEARSADAYARAVSLAPLSERYLIAYGNQLLNLHRPFAATAIFERAHAIDPLSAVALVGLGEASFRRGDRSAARTYLSRARALNPDDDAVVRLARELGG